MFELITAALFQLLSITNAPANQTTLNQSAGVTTTKGGSGGWGSGVVTDGGSGGWGSGVVANGGSGGWGSGITSK